jgi:ABC-type uncharacterized transport system permease subunit
LDILQLVLVAVASGTFVQTTPLLLPTLGEIYAEQSGVFNIGLEGIMLIAGSVAYIISAYSQSAYLALLAGGAIGISLGLLVAFFEVTLRVNQVVFGIGIILFGLGLSSFLVPTFLGNSAGIAASLLPSVSIPGLGEISHQDILFYVALSLVPISYFVIFRTHIGLALRMVGDDPLISDYIGLRVFRIRYIALIVCSLLAALGGVYMVLGTTGVWVDDITSGKGFVALALVRLANWRPQWALVFTLAFGFVETMQFRFAVTGSFVPYQVLQMSPYIFGVAVLVIASLFGLSSQPKSLGQPYRHGQK